MNNKENISSMVNSEVEKYKKRQNKRPGFKLIIWYSKLYIYFPNLRYSSAQKYACDYYLEKKTMIWVSLNLLYFNFFYSIRKYIKVLKWSRKLISHKIKKIDI